MHEKHGGYSHRWTHRPVERLLVSVRLKSHRECLLKLCAADVVDSFKGTSKLSSVVSSELHERPPTISISRYELNNYYREMAEGLKKHQWVIVAVFIYPTLKVLFYPQEMQNFYWQNPCKCLNTIVN